MSVGKFPIIVMSHKYPTTKPTLYPTHKPTMAPTTLQPTEGSEMGSINPSQFTYIDDYIQYTTMNWFMLGSGVILLVIGFLLFLRAAGICGKVEGEDDDERQPLISHKDHERELGSKILESPLSCEVVVATTSSQDEEHGAKVTLVPTKFGTRPVLITKSSVVKSSEAPISPKESAVLASPKRRRDDSRVNFKIAPNAVPSHPIKSPTAKSAESMSSRPLIVFPPEEDGNKSETASSHSMGSGGGSKSARRVRTPKSPFGIDMISVDCAVSAAQLGINILELRQAYDEAEGHEKLFYERILRDLSSPSSPTPSKRKKRPSSRASASSSKSSIRGSAKEASSLSGLRSKSLSADSCEAAPVVDEWGLSPQGGAGGLSPQGGAGELATTLDFGTATDADADVNWGVGAGLGVDVGAGVGAAVVVGADCKGAALTPPAVGREQDRNGSGSGNYNGGEERSVTAASDTEPNTLLDPPGGRSTKGAVKTTTSTAAEDSSEFSTPKPIKPHPVSPAARRSSPSLSPYPYPSLSPSLARPPLVQGGVEVPLDVTPTPVPAGIPCPAPAPAPVRVSRIPVSSSRKVSTPHAVSRAHFSKPLSTPGRGPQSPLGVGFGTGTGTGEAGDDPP